MDGVVGGRTQEDIFGFYLKEDAKSGEFALYVDSFVAGWHMMVFGDLSKICFINYYTH